MTRYDPRFCSKKRLQHLSIRDQAEPPQAQQLVDILAARRSVWVSEISLPKKLAKGLRKKILARRKDAWGSDYPAVARWVVR